MVSLEIKIKPSIGAKLAALATDNGMSENDYASMRLEKLIEQELNVDNRPLWEKLVEVGERSAGSKLPSDFAINHDHYVHGAPKLES